MKLIKDLGTQPVNKTSKYTVRFGIYECPSCSVCYRARTSDVLRGRSKQCRPCKDNDVATHRETTTKLYWLWRRMKARCYDKNRDNYNRYGGRGISVCEEWRTDYLTFKQWAVTNGYSEKLSIDRRDNNLGYSPGNCRFVTPTIQSCNREKMKNNTSGYIGVSRFGSKWATAIKYRGISYYLGSFVNKIIAAKIRDQFVISNDWPHKLNFYNGEALNP